MLYLATLIVIDERTTLSHSAPIITTPFRMVIPDTPVDTYIGNIHAHTCTLVLEQAALSPIAVLAQPFKTVSGHANTLHIYDHSK